MKARCKRRGAILVSALVCLLVSLSLVSTMVASTLQRRAQLKVERQARQSLHLLIAGHQRACQQLRVNAEYAGETWEAAVSDSERGEVRILAMTAESGLTRIDISATFPAGSPRAIQRSGTFYLSPPKPNEEKSS